MRWREAGALEALVRAAGERRCGRCARREEEGLFAGVEPETSPALPALTRAEQLVLDYETDRRLSGRPPDAPRCAPRFRSASAARRSYDDPARRARHAAGIVICRQRPQTASGVVFVTLEDETGFINLILYARIFERFRHVATTSTLLLAHGKIEREGEVVYVVVNRVERLVIPQAMPSMSRDFH